MKSRIVVFLGLAENTDPARYALEGGEAASLASETTRLPWNVWFDCIRADGGKPEEATIVVVGSAKTEETWLESGFLDDDLHKIGMPYDRRHIAFLPYDWGTLLEAHGVGGFWAFFDALRKVLAGEPLSGVESLRWLRGADADERVGHVVVDITHGFRSIPFLGGAVLEFVQTAARRDAEQTAERRDEAHPAPRHRVFYAAAEAGKEGNRGDVPVWELTPFLEAVELSRALDAFMRHGRADDLAEFLARSAEPACQRLAEPMRAFADDLLFTRLPNLLEVSGPALQRALAADLPSLVAAFRSVGPDLQRFGSAIERLVPGGQPLAPVDRRGIAAAAELAKRLWETGHYLALHCLIRESLVTAFTVLAVEPGVPIAQPGGKKAFKIQRDTAEGYSRDIAVSGAEGGPRDIVAPDADGFERQRSAAEAFSQGKRPAGFREPDAELKLLVKATNEIAQTRNDLAHWSMRANPLTTEQLRDRLAADLDYFLKYATALSAEN